MAKAIANGKATMPTMTPATTSFIIRSAVSSGKIDNSFGLNMMRAGKKMNRAALGGHEFLYIDFLTISQRYQCSVRSFFVPVQE
jgi:hypothetical protein